MCAQNYACIFCVCLNIMYVVDMYACMDMSIRVHAYICVVSKIFIGSE